MSEPLPKTGFLLLAGLTLFWGLNWPGMKIILAELPVLWFRASCLIVGGASLLAIAIASGSKWRLQREEIAPVCFCALFNVGGWHLLSAYGVSIMPAGRASIIAFTMPIWAALFSGLLLKERIDKPKIAGLFLGLAGLTVLIGPDLAVFNQAPLGPLFMIGAALSWGFGTVLFKRELWTTSIVSLVAWQLLLIAVPLTISAVIFEPLPDLSVISTEALLALMYVYAFPMVFCQWAYFKTVKLFPATVAAVGTLLVPVVGVYSSSIIIDEPVGWRELTALMLICSALISVMFIPAVIRNRTQAS